MDLVELWVLLKTRYDENRYNGWQLTHLQRQFKYITHNVNETEIATGISGRKVAKKPDWGPERRDPAQYVPMISFSGMYQK